MILHVKGRSKMAEETGNKDVLIEGLIDFGGCQDQRGCTVHSPIGAAPDSFDALLFLFATAPAAGQASSRL
jgi:hypothetical protein